MMNLLRRLWAWLDRPMEPDEGHWLRLFEEWM